jgi:hypothetical protein
VCTVRKGGTCGPALGLQPHESDGQCPGRLPHANKGPSDRIRLTRLAYAHNLTTPLRRKETTPSTTDLIEKLGNAPPSPLPQHGRLSRRPDDELRGHDLRRCEQQVVRRKRERPIEVHIAAAGLRHLCQYRADHRPPRV